MVSASYAKPATPVFLLSAAGARFSKRWDLSKRVSAPAFVFVLQASMLRKLRPKPDILAPKHLSERLFPTGSIATDRV